MSFIVKGVDLPKEGCSVNIEVSPNGRCSVMEIEEGECYRLEFNREAQAVQIPKNHGRLIDADKIDYDEFWHREGHGFTIRVCQKAQQIIEEQPTILEAEEETCETAKDV